MVNQAYMDPFVQFPLRRSGKIPDQLFAEQDKGFVIAVYQLFKIRYIFLILNHKYLVNLLRQLAVLVVFLSESNSSAQIKLFDSVCVKNHTVVVQYFQDSIWF